MNFKNVFYGNNMAWSLSEFLFIGHVSIVVLQTLSMFATAQ